MRPIALIFGAVLGLGCSPEGPGSAALEPAQVVGSYYDEGISPVGELVLAAGGTYECSIYNGSVDGCATVEGAGISLGVWAIEGDRVVLTPREESAIGHSGLVLSLEGATATPSDAGLVLWAGGAALPLERRE